MMKVYKAVHERENKCKELHKEMNMNVCKQTEKSVAEMCNVPEENVIPISRLEYEAYMDE